MVPYKDSLSGFLPGFLSRAPHQGHLPGFLSPHSFVNSLNFWMFRYSGSWIQDPRCILHCPCRLWFKELFGVIALVMFLLTIACS